MRPLGIVYALAAHYPWQWRWSAPCGAEGTVGLAGVCLAIRLARLIFLPTPFRVSLTKPRFSAIIPGRGSIDNNIPSAISGNNK